MEFSWTSRISCICIRSLRQPRKSKARWRCFRGKSALFLWCTAALGLLQCHLLTSAKCLLPELLFVSRDVLLCVPVDQLDKSRHVLFRGAKEARSWLLQYYHCITDNPRLICWNTFTVPLLSVDVWKHWFARAANLSPASDSCLLHTAMCTAIAADVP